MINKGHSQSDETKKKISEALKKKSGGSSSASQPNRSREAQKLFNDYQHSQETSKRIGDALSSLKNQFNALPKPSKKMSKSEKAKLKTQKEAMRKQATALHERLKQERVKQQEIRQKAAEAQRMKVAQENIVKAQARIAKANLNLKKADALEVKVKGLIGKAKKPEIKAALEDRLKQIADSRQNQTDSIKHSNDTIKEQNSVIKSKGKVQRVMFNFGEMFAGNVYLHEKKFLIWRDLSLQEKRVDFQMLNETYNQLETDLQDELTQTVQDDVERSIVKVQNRLKAGDVAGLAAIAFISANKIYDIVNKYTKAAYEKGKKSAAQELKVGQPVTPTLKTQLMNLDSDMISEAFATDIDLAAKQKAKEGLSKGVATVAIIGAIAATVHDRSSKMITNAVGNLIGENLNKGRRLVFEDNVTRIKAYERSEILDGRTCNLCISLDKRVVTADDPMAQLDEVHDNCRGIWVPVLTEEELPAEPGIPSTVVDAFDTMGGVPSVNAFKQLKKPINAGNQEAQKEIKRRLESNSPFNRKFGK